MSTRISLLAIVLAACAVGTVAQDKVVKHGPITATSAASGKEMFVNYCAVCHGTDGKGTGPAASALKEPPANLTTLAQKNGGKLPSNHVSATLRGQASPGAHGNKEMPVWGPVFRQISQGHEDEVHQRIANLTKYVESLQAK